MSSIKYSSFDRSLATCTEEIELLVRGFESQPWADYLLNPRRLRGSDFLMRWQQGRWSEDRIIQAVNDTDRFYAIPYGPSGVAPDNDVRAYELYFEKLDAAGLANIKRPDLLLFRSEDRITAESIIAEIGGAPELPFTREDDPRMVRLLALAVVAIECENSLWKVQLMKDYGSTLRPQKRLGGKMGLPKSAVLPTVIIKEEDRDKIREWQTARGVPIHVWQAFYDKAYGVSFDNAEALINTGQITPTIQTYQAPNGIIQKKLTYRIYYQHGYVLGESIEEPTLIAASITDPNGHIMPYVRFTGGNLRLLGDGIQVLNNLAARA